MAKLTFKDSQPDFFQMYQQYSSGELGRHSGTVAIFESNTNNGTLIFSGKDFVYDHGDLIEGTVTNVTFKDAAGGVCTVLSGIKLNAANLPDQSLSYFGYLTAQMALKGNDTIRGSAGSDYLEGKYGNDVLLGGGGGDRLYGEQGDDKLTGGSGADEFHFSSGHDVITDFDFKGPERDALYIPVDPIDIRSTSKGLLLEFTDHDSVLLTGVKNFEQIEDVVYLVS